MAANEGSFLTSRSASLGRKRIITIYQPHLYSRTETFAREFAEALAVSDKIILTDIYPAREEPIPGVTSELIIERAAAEDRPRFVSAGKKVNAVDVLKPIVEPGDLVIVMGAGSITHIREQLLECLTNL